HAHPREREGRAGADPRGGVGLTSLRLPDALSTVRAELAEALPLVSHLKPFFVDLLRCSDGSYYVGQTDDLGERLRQHGDGLIGYTATRKPIEWLRQGEFESRESAIAFERRIKGWSRARKEALIRGDWPAIQQLARSRAGPNVQAVGPELAEGRDGAQASLASRLRQAQPERAGGKPMGEAP
ncbi:MAG: GIY-YIG nuclease family protein, partial [Pseudomonadota bacterium]|nr:GIY-YIG nuclease family protein [Pseudomonadota bacterium]